MTAIAGSRVAIVGGSLAGCAAAIALLRAGCAVTIFERSVAELRDRGFGIAIPVPLHEELVAAGYLNSGMPTRHGAQVTWMVREARTSDGRVISRLPFDGRYNNWGVLWRTVRAQVPDESYCNGRDITGIRVDPDGVTIATADGRDDQFDLVVGADGYRSIVRELIDPAAQPIYAGYGLWRGSYTDDRLPAASPPELDRGGVGIVFPGGHGAFYFMPDFAGERLRMNWAVYSAVPQWPKSGSPVLLPPGSVNEDFAAVLEQILTAHYPARWAEIVRQSTRSELSLQPIYDTTVSSYVADRVILIGDASALARPHAAAGATKALQDALALERACREHGTWDRALTAYDAARREEGNSYVELARRLGKALVEETPPWDSMSPGEHQEWLAALMAGRRWPHDAS
jgi:2-polyprenyl-6-methoxyphenol hydroxylase-like FAD-dependent oxidoreductase